MHALRELRDDGKVREIGVSNFTLDEVQEAHQALGSIPLVANQIRLNLLQRAPLAPGGIVDWCSERGISTLAYSPLAEGRLARGAHSEPEPTLQQALASLTELVEETEFTTSAVALAWLTELPGIRSVVVGASSIPQLDEQLRFSAVPDQLVLEARRLVEGVQLHESWEGPFWKRKLRSLKRKIMRH